MKKLPNLLKNRIRKLIAKESPGEAKAASPARRHFEATRRKVFETRRNLILGGGALLAVAAGGFTWRAFNTGVFESGEGPAFEPWQDWQGDSTAEGPLSLVRAGILAASSHNSQPWLFRIGPDTIDVLADPERHLGAMDPFRRDQHISLGCALENMVLAAGAQGFSTRLELFPERLDEFLAEAPLSPAARLHLKPKAGKAPGLYKAIAQRHTNRGAYIPDRPVPPATIWAFNDLAREDQKLRLVLLQEGANRARFDALMVEATEGVVSDAEMVAARTDWLRQSPAEIKAHRSGLTIDSFGLEPVARTALKLLPKPDPEQAHRRWVAATRDTQLATAPLVGMIAVQDPYDREAALRTGVLWQRLHLWAAAQGLAMQPLNQAFSLIDRQLQLGVEPELAARLAEVVGDDRWKPVLAFRAGYPVAEAQPSPRRGVDELILDAAPQVPPRERPLISEGIGF